MPIPTKLNFATKLPAENEKTSAEADGLPTKTSKIALESDFYEDPSQEAERLDKYLLWRRRRILSYLLVMFLLFWLLLAAVLGTLVFYRYIARRAMFVGSCITEVIDDDGDSPLSMVQAMEVGGLNSQVEMMRVPAFGPNRPAAFFHDFNQNITVIKDILGSVCYLKPLDRSQLAPPSNMIDLIQKMLNDYYLPKSTVIRNNYRIQRPALTEKQMEELNSKEILQGCSGVATYWLVAQEQDGSRRMRRSLASADCDKASFAYLAKQGTVVSENVELCP